MELFLFLVFVSGWVGIGFFTALVRWRWIEGAERISAGVAAREVEAACDQLILGGGVPPGFAELHYENTKQHAKNEFFGASMVLGPIGTIIFLMGMGWHATMEKVKN